jgi:hypothetical protein
MAAAYRIRQGLRALTAFAQPVDVDLAARYLNPALLACFRTMRRAEQLHSLRVLRAVLAQGDTPHDLAVAALLHDVGKSRYPFPVWQKTLVVLARALTPGLFTRLSCGRETDWRCRPFVLSAQHPAWSAAQVAAAGGSPRAVWLIAHHATPPETLAGHEWLDLLRRLRAADDAH